MSYCRDMARMYCHVVQWHCHNVHYLIQYLVQNRLIIPFVSTMHDYSYNSKIIRLPNIQHESCHEENLPKLYQRDAVHVTTMHQCKGSCGHMNQIRKRGDSIEIPYRTKEIQYRTKEHCQWINTGIQICVNIHMYRYTHIFIRGYRFN